MKITHICGFPLILFLLVCEPVFAQNDTILHPEILMDEILDMDEGRTSANYDDAIQELQERIKEPLNLNNITQEQLQQFPFLTDLQIENILAYLYIHGEMKSVYELQLVKDMDWQTIRYLSPFVCVNPVEKEESLPSLRDLYIHGRHEASTCWNVPFYRSKGYKDKYMGPPFYHSLRYAYHYNDKIYAGFCGEKDKGEPFGALHNRKGYDSYSAYVLLKDMGKWKTLALGDYRISFGQGLVVSQDFLLGKSTYFSTIIRRGNAIRKHSSTDELNFFRGLAASYCFSKQLCLTSFLSYRHYDGTLKGDTISSIHESGLHRTQKEADDRNALGIFTVGSNLNYTRDSYHVDITGLYYQLNHPYEPAFREYNKYSLHGSSFYNIGTDYSCRLHRITLSGEFALGKRGVATVNRLSYSPSQGYHFLLLHRYYAHNYWSYYAHSFSDGTGVQNENGWFLAADIVPFRRFSFFGALDLISFPGWKYRVSKPSKATDAIFRCTYIPQSKTEMDLSCRYRRRERDVSGSKGKDTRPTHQYLFRYRLRETLSPYLKLKMSADCHTFQQKGFDKRCGYQFTQTVEYVCKRLPLQLIFQGSYFHTDDYDTRVYIYERSQLYSFYIPSYQYTGLRMSLRLQGTIGRHLLFIVHGGQTHYYHQDSFGSGDDEVKGNRKTDLLLQMRVKF